MWRWRRKPKPLSCQEVVALVTEYLEGTLPEKMKRRFEAHLDACLACPEYVAQIKAVAMLAGRPNPDDEQAPTEEEAAALFRSLRQR